LRFGRAQRTSVARETFDGDERCGVKVGLRRFPNVQMCWVRT